MDILDVLREWDDECIDYERFIDLMMIHEERRDIFDELNTLCHSYRRTKEPRSMFQIVDGVCDLWRYVSRAERANGGKKMFETIWDAEREFNVLQADPYF